jgi:hypothetical protein
MEVLRLPRRGLATSRRFFYLCLPEARKPVVRSGSDKGARVLVASILSMNSGRGQGGHGISLGTLALRGDTGPGSVSEPK